jgi:hypothetical protein
MPTSFESPLIEHGPPVGVGLPFSRQREFLRRQPSSIVDSHRPDSANDQIRTGLRDQAVMRREEMLVRLPYLLDSKQRVKVLQRWVGRVERIERDSFTAVVNDAMNSHNPPELVELSFDEISTGDIPMIAVGATFYWSIGYLITPGGQRERVSSLRFARQPCLSKFQIKGIFDQAERLATFLESD